MDARVDDPGSDAEQDAQADASGDVEADTSPDPIGDAAPDPAHDPEPDGPCVTMGCPRRGSEPCCEELVEAHDCLPGVECPEVLLYCLRCGDSTCSPHENAFNCPTDCPAGCEEESSMSYGCSPIETQICTCIEDPCEPFCDMMRGSAWIDGCTDTPISGTSDCFPFGHLECLHIGTDDEGWYDTQWEGEVRVTHRACQPRWACEVAW